MLNVGRAHMVGAYTWNQNATIYQLMQMEMKWAPAPARSQKKYWQLLHRKRTHHLCLSIPITIQQIDIYMRNASISVTTVRSNRW